MSTLAFIGVSQDFYNFLVVARIVLLAVIALCCLITIVTTLLQSSANAAGGNAITGGESESYFSHNKDNSRDGRLKRTTITMAIVIVSCLVLYFLTGVLFTKL